MARAPYLLAVGPLLGVVAVLAGATPHPAVAPRASLWRPPVLQVPAPRPFACFAAKGCPGIHAEICFAAAAATEHKPPCPAIRGRYKLAAPPPLQR